MNEPKTAGVKAIKPARLQKPRPDDGELLTIDEERKLHLKWIALSPNARPSWRDCWLAAQRDLTASIKEATFAKKCQECEYDPQAAGVGWFVEHDWLSPEEARRKESEWGEKFSRFVGKGFCISPKLVLTNDEVGWFARYLPNAPKEDGEVSVIGDGPFDALDRLWQALGKGVK